jgi:hypothetical protein
MNDALLDGSVEGLGEMSARVRDGLLKRNNIDTVRQLISHTREELAKTPKVGRATLDELELLLTRVGLSLAEKIDRLTRTEPLPFPSLHDRIRRIEERLDKIEGHSLLRVVGDMSGHMEPHEP